MRSPAAILALATASVACGSPPPAAAPAASADPTAASTPTAPPVAPETPPSASVTAVDAPKGDTAPARAKVVFTNPSSRPCRFLGYTLLWGSARKVITLDGFTVPPGESRERWIKVAPADGDLRLLTPEASRVEVKAECGDAKP